MTNLPKYAAYGIAGLALLVGSFVTFSVLTGTPMNEMKAVGGLFPESAEAELVAGGEAEPATPEEERASDLRSPRAVFESAATPLGAFALQDPFSAEELRNLERSLMTKLNELSRRDRELDARERQLDEERRHLDDLYTEFETLRNSILEGQAENLAAADEVKRETAVLDEKKEKVYRELAQLYEDGKAADAASMLTKTYGPDEAANVLIKLDADRRREVIGAIYQLLPEEGVRYYRALQDLMAR